MELQDRKVEWQEAEFKLSRFPRDNQLKIDVGDTHWVVEKPGDLIITKNGHLVASLEVRSAFDAATSVIQEEILALAREFAELTSRCIREMAGDAQQL